jgi:hypothetical protein
MIGLGSLEAAANDKGHEPAEALIGHDSAAPATATTAATTTTTPTNHATLVSIDDLLNVTADALPMPPLVLPTSAPAAASSTSAPMSKFEESRASRTRGLDELDFLEPILRISFSAENFSDKFLHKPTIRTKFNCIKNYYIQI